MRTHLDRLHDELKAVGCHARIVEGTADVRSGNAFIAQAVMTAHIEDEAEWLATDLEVHAEDVQALATDGQWAAYLKVQTDRIRELRYEAYTARGGVNDYVMEAMSDGENYTIIKEEAKEIKELVKATYPWPGDYR